MKNKPIKAIFTAGIMLAALSTTTWAAPTEAAAIANNSIKGQKLKDGTVTGAKLAPATVTGDKIANGAITNAQLAPSFVFQGGPTGPQGPAGPAGATGAAGASPFSLSGSNAFYTAGNVGIGTSNILAKFHVNGTGSSDDGKLLVQTSGGTFGPQIRLNHAGTGGDEWVLVSNGSINQGGVGDFHIVQASNGLSRFFITKSGNVAIGKDAEATVDRPLTVSGPTGVAGYQGVFGIQNGSTGQGWNFDIENQFAGDLIIYAAPGTGGGSFGRFSKSTSAYSTSSDRRLKKQIEPLTSVLERTMQLQPVSYRFNSQSDDARRSLGFVAQDVEPLFPEVVTTADKAGELTDVKSLGYAEMVPIAIGAIRELKQEKDAEIARLHAENTTLAATVAALEAKDKAREARLTRLEASLPAPAGGPVTASLEAK